MDGMNGEKNLHGYGAHIWRERKRTKLFFPLLLLHSYPHRPQLISTLSSEKNSVSAGDANRKVLLYRNARAREKKKTRRKTQGKNREFEHFLLYPKYLNQFVTALNSRITALYPQPRRRDHHGRSSRRRRGGAP